MNLTYGVIRGEKDFNAYCMKRWGQELYHWSGCFNREIPEVTVERLWEKSPTDEHYKEYYLMTAPTQKEEPYYPDHATIRKKVYEDIRTGRVNIIKV